MAQQRSRSNLDLTDSQAFEAHCVQVRSLHWKNVELLGQLIYLDDRIKIAQIHSIKLPDPFGTQSTSQAVLEKT
jgi:hypothetical protein